MSDNTKVFVALIAGVAAGAAVALLVAPDKGSALRKRLADSTKGFTDSLLEKAEETVGNFVSGITEKFVSETEPAQGDQKEQEHEERTARYN